MKFTFTRNNADKYSIADRPSDNLKEEYLMKGREVSHLDNDSLFRVAVLTDTAYLCPQRGIIRFTVDELEQFCQNFHSGYPNTGVALYAGHPTLIDGGGREAYGWCFEDADGMYVAEINYTRGRKEVTENAIIVEGFWTDKGREAYKSKTYRFTSVEASMQSKDREMGNLSEAVAKRHIEIVDGKVKNNKDIGRLITGIALTNDPAFNLPEIQSESYELSDKSISMDNIVAFRDIVGQPSGDITFYNSQGQRVVISEIDGKTTIKKDMVVNFTAMPYDYTEEFEMPKTKEEVAEETKAEEAAVEVATEKKQEEVAACKNCETAECEGCEPKNEEEAEGEAEAEEAPAAEAPAAEAPAAEPEKLELSATTQNAEAEAMLLAMKAQLEASQLELSRAREDAELQKLQLKEELERQQEVLAALNQQLAMKSRESYIARVDNSCEMYSKQGLPEAVVKSIRGLLIEASTEVREAKFNFSNAATNSERSLDIFGVVDSIVSSFDSKMFKSADPIENDARDSGNVVTDNSVKVKKNPLL